MLFCGTVHRIQGYYKLPGAPDLYWSKHAIILTLHIHFITLMLLRPILEEDYSRGIMAVSVNCSLNAQGHKDRYFHSTATFLEIARIT
jgi:hypothetical protein